jgi:hypothetical protein
MISAPEFNANFTTAGAEMTKSKLVAAALATVMPTIVDPNQGCSEYHG